MLLFFSYSAITQGLIGLIVMLLTWAAALGSSTRSCARADMYSGRCLCRWWWRLQEWLLQQLAASSSRRYLRVLRLQVSCGGDGNLEDRGRYEEDSARAELLSVPPRLILGQDY